jgi:hypothetical protein
MRTTLTAKDIEAIEVEFVISKEETVPALALFAGGLWQFDAVSSRGDNNFTVAYEKIKRLKGIAHTLFGEIVAVAKEVQAIRGFGKDGKVFDWS